MKKRMTQIIVSVFVVYLIAVIAVVMNQRMFIFPRGGGVPDISASGVDGMVEIAIKTKDGLEIKGWYSPAKSGADTILMFHGNGGTIAYRVDHARLWQQAGFGVLLLEYRGYGGNPGSPSEDGLMLDGEAAFTHLQDMNIAAENIIVYGESLGTGVAVQMAAKYPVKAVILEAPYTSIAQLAAAKMPFIPLAQYLVWDRFDSMAFIGKITAPLLIIHGEKDVVVPVQYGRTLFAAAPEPKRMLEYAKAGHTNLYQYGAGQDVLAFLGAN